MPCLAHLAPLPAAPSSACSTSGRGSGSAAAAPPRLAAAAAAPCGRRHWRQRGGALVVASQPNYKSDAEAHTEKFGLEAGLWKVWTDKGADGSMSKGEQAKQLLARYGSAYLLTSISFAIVSMTCCYLAVDAGVDVSGLLSRIGIQVTNTSETVGTFAIAYAAHKALSPVRFPPTVALTPVVARWLGKEPAAAAAGAPGAGEQQPGREE